MAAKDKIAISRARHPDDDPLHSSLKQIEGFEEHNTWIDMCEWIEESIEYLQDELTEADSVEEIKKLQGRILELKNIKTVPEMFRQQLIAEQQLEQQNNKEE